MTNTISSRELIDKLRMHNGGLCVSIIIPLGTHDAMETKALKISQAVAKARRFIPSQQAVLAASLDKASAELLDDVHFNRTCSGIGLFVSQDIRERYQFVFPVKERVLTGERFEIVDLLYQAQFEVPGHILLINNKGARLFTSDLLDAQEIIDQNFPVEYADEYEYARPARGSSHTGHAVVQQFEKDRQSLQQTHFEHFLRQVDQRLTAYKETLGPLVLSGPPKVVPEFEALSAFKQQVVGILPGNYARSSAFELHQLTQHLFHDQVNNQVKHSIQQTEEKEGAQLAVEGIADCWEAVAEGKGLLLIVEKDFTTAGFLKVENESRLFLDPPRAKHRVVTDVVNELVHTMLSKNGEVLIAENGQLRDHHRIALVKRYA